MHRGAWWATVRVLQRVGHDPATMWVEGRFKGQFGTLAATFLLSKTAGNTLKMQILGTDYLHLNSGSYLLTA